MKNKIKLPPQKKPMGQTRFNWRLLLCLGLLWLFVFYFFGRFFTDDTMRMSYTAFKKHVRQGNVAGITLKNHEVAGSFKEPVKGEPHSSLFGKNEAPKYTSFKTTIPSLEDPKLMDLLETN